MEIRHHDTLAPLPDHVKEALQEGPTDPETGLSLADANGLLQPGYLPLETGYTRLSN